jgi:hypothetical protein
MSIVEHGSGHDEMVECPTCGQQASAKRITALEQARELDWLNRRDLLREYDWRFRELGGWLFPGAVSRAYDENLEQALADSDEEVFTRVHAWEWEHGHAHVEWATLGILSRAAREQAGLSENDEIPF